MAQLRIVGPDGSLQTRGITAARLLIGRAASCDWVLEDSRVSSRHLQIWQEGGCIFVEEVRARNGTVVNDRVLTGKASLAIGDRLVLGQAVHIDVVADDAVMASGLRGGALEWAATELQRFGAVGGRYAILQLLVDIAVEVTGAPTVWALTWQGSTILGLAAHGDVADLPAPDQISSSLVGRTSEAGQAIWIDDALEDEGLKNAPSIRILELRSLGCVPIGGSGALYLSDPAGAERFPPEVRARLEALCQLVAPMVDGPSAVSTVSEVPPIPGLVGDSAAMLEVARAIRAFAPMPWPLLVVGETGTGKELVASAIHDLSGRKGLFAAVNCGAIPESLAESTLFGHERGAFTGAERQHLGWVERAAQGTLFLDEVGELPQAVQVKLLRLMSEGTYERVGGQRTLRFTGRIVAATHQDIDTSDSSFRRDLFFRFANVLRTPALRDRPRDIEVLANHLLRQLAADIPGAKDLVIAPASLAILRRRSYPGNVRELGNVIKAAIGWCLHHGGTVIAPTHLHPGGKAAVQGSQWDEMPFDEAIAAYERYRVRLSMLEAGGNISAAAALLGVSRQRLYRVLEKWPDRDF